MSVGIKKMLAERAKAAAEYRVVGGFEEGVYKREKWDRVVDEVFSMIDNAAAFMDENTDQRHWPASYKLKLIYCISATGPNASATTSREALQFVLSMLDKAREMWINGHVPDPFAEIPKLRAGAAR